MRINRTSLNLSQPNRRPVNVSRRPSAKAHEPAVLTWRRLVIVACIAAWGLTGCTDPPQFRENSVEIRKQEIFQRLEDDESYPEQHLQDISNLLIAMFGTPDDPWFPTELGGDFEGLISDGDIVSIERLQMAAGPVSSDRMGKAQGLYRKHCVHCHGITGDGAGPTASFLNPYPRDYRLGRFKFKSTPGADKPTREDLRRVIREGIPGTSMNSFNLLKEEEIEALVDYVIYLTVRGEVERTLIASFLEYFELDERVLENQEDDPENSYLDNLDWIMDEFVSPSFSSWAAAESRQTPVPARPETLELGHPEREAMIDRGRDLFMSSTGGNCFSCHGYTGLGDGVNNNLDDWTKDWVEGGKVDLEDSEAVAEFVKLGALPPRPISPRNLRLGVYRGGGRPRDLFWRIKNGISASGMPSAGALSDEDIWCLVEFVRALPYETLSQPADTLPENPEGVR